MCASVQPYELPELQKRQFTAANGSAGCDQQIQQRAIWSTTHSALDSTLLAHSNPGITTAAARPLMSNQCAGAHIETLRQCEHELGRRRCMESISSPTIRSTNMSTSFQTPRPAEICQAFKHTKHRYCEQLRNAYVTVPSLSFVGTDETGRQSRAFFAQVVGTCVMHLDRTGICR